VSFPDVVSVERVCAGTWIVQLTLGK